MIGERKKRGLISYLSFEVVTKILPGRKNEIFFLRKMAAKVGIYSATHESVTVARGQRLENTDRAKNLSDCAIRYGDLSEKK